MTFRSSLFLASGAIIAIALAASAQQAPDFPAPRTVEGQPIETRPPEKADDKPLFPQQTRAPYHKSVRYKITVLTDKLYAPWNIAFLPDGNILVTERLPGTIRMLDKAGNLSAPFTGLAGLSTVSGIGMLDVALDPHFASNHRVFFAFFEYNGKTDSNTYVGRGILDEANHAVTNAEVIFRSMPAWPSTRLGGKTGGRIVFDPQGNLILPIGDRSDSPPWEVAQRMDVHLGKIIRITQDGKPAPGNPFLKTPGALPEIWAPRHPQPGRLRHRSRQRQDLGNRTWPARRRRTQHHRERQELRLAGDHPRNRLSRTPVGAGITAKDGMVQPIYYWDPGDRAVGIGLLSRRPVPGLEAQPVRRRPARQFPRPAGDIRRQGGGGGTAADRTA